MPFYTDFQRTKFYCKTFLPVHVLLHVSIRTRVGTSDVGFSFEKLTVEQYYLINRAFAIKRLRINLNFQSRQIDFL